MKKKLTIIGLLGFTFLFGCTQTQHEAGAKIPDGFVLIERNEEVFSAGKVYEIKHVKTGYHYIITTNGNSSVTQMLDKDGLPYCN